MNNIRIRAGSGSGGTHEVYCRGREAPVVHLFLSPSGEEIGPNGVESYPVACEDCQRGQDCFCPISDMTASRPA